MGRISLKNTAGTGNPRVSAEGGADTGITFDNDQDEEILIIDSVAASVNQLTISSAATGNDPDIAGTGDDTDVGVSVTAKGAGVITLAGPVVSSNGVRHTAAAATATADGLTTGLIALGTSFVAVTSASANNIVTLPAGTPGQIIWIYVGANGCELRTPASSTATINNVNSDGTNELALGATTSYVCVCVATDTWIVRGFTNLGADQAALVPDAA